MLKPSGLRDAIVAGNPFFRDDPDKLKLYIDNGRLVATGTPSRSFEWRYQLQLAVMDYTGSAEAIAVPMLFWLRANQPSLFADPATRDQAITFKAEILDATKQDIIFTTQLSEVVAVTKNDQGSWDVNPIPEPAYGDDGYELPIAGDIPPNMRSILLGDVPLIGDPQ